MANDLLGLSGFQPPESGHNFLFFKDASPPIQEASGSYRLVGCSTKEKSGFYLNLQNC